MVGSRSARRKNYLWPVALATAIACGCAPSAEEVKREFDAYVAEVNHCEEASQCTLAAAGCPLGCAVAVRVEAKEDVERKARELIEDYESDGTMCAYECIEISSVECRHGRCATAR